MSWRGWRGLGHGVSVAAITDHEDTLVGLLERHLCCDRDGKALLSTGSLPFLLPPGRWPADWPRWQIRSTVPLTIVPGVLCPACGLHGRIAGGVWTPYPDSYRLRQAIPPPRTPQWW